MHRRLPPRGTKNLQRFARLAWLLLLLVGVSGCASFHRRPIQYHLEPQYSVEDPQFLRSMEYLMGPSIKPENQVTALINGDQIFPAMLAAVRGAQKSICLETYIYWSGEVGREFTDALCERARAGVKVHVLVDWIGSRRFNRALLKQMRAAGVEVHKHNPFHWLNPIQFNYRDHRKLLIVDGRVGFTGGAGIADIWRGNADAPDHWRDSMFRLEGPAVGQMQGAFMDNWAKTSGRVLDGPDYFPALSPAGHHYAQVFFSSPKDGVESVRLMYLLSFAAARKNIRLSASYFVPGKLTTRELVDASKRGVKVEIILPGAETDSPTVRHASRSKWGPLLEAGVKIYEYQPTMYHCKVMIVDDVWISVGSANFDNRSFRLNDEANLNIFAPDFAAQLVETFEADKKQSDEMTYEEWKNRSLCKRILEFLISPFRPQI